MSQFDVLNRYLFADSHARGELVQLDQCYKSIIKNHNYPQGVQILLGELLAATSLLTATLKFEGDITVQLQGDGPIGYLSVSGNHEQQMRGIAKLKQDTQATGLHALIGKGTMVITIRPSKGEAYQGVVALEHDTLAECLAHYFEVSEQIPTKLWLFADSQKQLAGGALVQLLPDGDDKEKQLNDFEHLSQLSNTVKAEEIFTLEAEALLYRLYHQEQVNLFEPQKISYVCGCSEEKCLAAISQIEPSEISAILKEQGKISMHCDFCLTTYDFDEAKLQGFISKLKY